MHIKSENERKQYKYVFRIFPSLSGVSGHWAMNHALSLRNYNLTTRVTQHYVWKWQWKRRSERDYEQAKHL